MRSFAFVIGACRCVVCMRNKPVDFCRRCANANWPQFSAVLPLITLFAATTLLQTEHTQYSRAMSDYKGEFMQGEVEADSGVLHLRLNRAPVNAVSGQYFFEIGHFFQLAKGDPNVRAIVLSSTLPKYFTAGLDLKEAAGSLNSYPGDIARKALALKKHVLGEFRQCTKPD